MPPFDWTQLLQLAPGILAGVTGNPAAGGAYFGNLADAVGEGQALRLRQQQLEQQAAQQAFLQENMLADNARQDELLELQRIQQTAAQQQAKQRELLELLAVMDQFAEQQGALAPDPVAAENALLGRSAALESAFGVPAGQLAPFVPNMGPLISARKQKQAQALYDRAEKRYGPEAMANDSLTLQTGDLFGDVKPSELRALFELPAVDAQGAPAVSPTPRDMRIVDLGGAKQAIDFNALEPGQTFAETPSASAGPAPQYQWATDPATGETRLMTVEEIRRGDARQPPTADMRNKDAGRSLVQRSIDAIQTLSARIITRVGPAQRAQAMKRGAEAVFGNDPDFRTYQDARMALAGNLAVAQQGSRPSDADIRAIWLPLVPNPYADTSESAKLKWELIRTMSNAPPSEGGLTPTLGGTVRMRAPNGQEQDVPAREVEHYRAQGAVVVE